MSFIKETTDFDLGDTPVENIFINDYMPIADGTNVKVYLLGYKYANDKDTNINLDNNTIAKNLKIPLSDVTRAWDFWEQQGIIKKHIKDDIDEYDYKVEFLNLKQLYINNNFKSITIKNDVDIQPSKYVCSTNDLLDANSSEDIQQMFNSINHIIRRGLVPNEKKKILEWLQNYNMATDIIVKAYFYSVEKKNRKNLGYVAGIVRNWYDMNITNIDALNEHFKNNDQRFYRYDRVMKALGFGFRQATEAEMKIIDKWFGEWNFSMDMALKACENTSKTSKPSINYINAILASWYNKGIKTIEDITIKDKPSSSKSSPKTRSHANTKTKFHNFEQGTSKYKADELEKLIRGRK